MEFRRCYGCMEELPEQTSLCPHCGFDNGREAAQPNHALPCGSILDGRYVVGRMLGQGGFGITYIGYDLVLELRICIKEYFPDGAAMRSSAVSRQVYWGTTENAQLLKQGRESFIREARKAVKLRDLHHVVTVWDVFYENETAYIVMDYIEGETLKHYLARTKRRLSEKDCLRLLMPVIADLDEVHRRGIIHRDVKPDNLMFTTKGVLVLLDMGAAKDLGGSGAQSSALVASHGFSPPEQYRQNGNIGPWTDVYAMCATIYYGVSGKLPPAPLDRLSGEELSLAAFSPALAAVLQKGLAIQPSARYQRMSELNAALAQIEDKPAPAVEKVTKPAPEPELPKTRAVEPIRETEASVTEPESAPAAETAPTPERQKVKPKKRGKGVVIGAVAAALLALAALAVLLLPDLLGLGRAKPGTYQIEVWTSEVELTRQQIEAFNNSNEYGLLFDAKLVYVQEPDAAERMAGGVSSGGDLFSFPQDQLANLVRAGALSRVRLSTARAVSKANAKSAVQAGKIQNSLYAYPMTADNGYFMYYDASVIPESDLDDLDRLLADCVLADRSFCFQVESSSWYMASFFFATGCQSTWRVDGSGRFVSVKDNFDSKQGMIAAKGLKTLLSSSVFADTSSVEAFRRGAAVVISGTWDYEAARRILGDDFGAAELPSFGIEGRSYHLGSFGGCKLLGVKPQQDTDREAALHVLAQYLTGEQCQMQRLEILGWGPSNRNAQASPQAQENPALRALLAQSAYATPQGQIYDGWWDYGVKLAKDIKNATNDDELQAALDSYRERIQNGLP